MHRTSLLPVAQYLRMSTEHQQYSTVNQSVAILQYAQKHGMEIIRTYADHGKSGLSLATRQGLQQLLKDAVAPDVDFRAVLVYDVSRWGRFQNPDQAAAHEYMLHRASIPIHYCAEQFQNDGSLASAILKTLKRGMAGEYSRELSGKVWAGNRRIAELGFHIGGYAGYGLRRQLVGSDRKPKQVLKQGELKNLQSEHVVLIPGPAKELRTVRRIYAMYIDQSMSEREIANKLNGENVPWMGSRPWTRMNVRHILLNPKYVGASVYNRTSFKLQEKFIRNPRSEWIWCAGAFKPVVSEERFERAHQCAAERALKPTPEELIMGLKSLIKQKGRVSERLIDSSSDIPSAHTYIARFGSLRNAYRLAGWRAERQAKHLHIQSVVRETQSRLLAQLEEELSAFDAVPYKDRRTWVFATNAAIRFSVTVTRCSRDKGGRSYWHVYCREDVPADLWVVARLTEENDGIKDFFIFPNGVLSNSRLSVGRVNALELAEYRFDSLEILPTLLQCSDVEYVETSAFEANASPECADANAGYPATGAVLRNMMGELLADEDFRTLLRAENCSRIPDVFRRRVKSDSDRLAAAVCELFIAQLFRNKRIRAYIERRHRTSLGHRFV